MTDTLSCMWGNVLCGSMCSKTFICFVSRCTGLHVTRCLLHNMQHTERTPTTFTASIYFIVFLRSGGSFPLLTMGIKWSVDRTAAAVVQWLILLFDKHQTTATLLAFNSYSSYMTASQWLRLTGHVSIEWFLKFDLILEHEHKNCGKMFRLCRNPDEKTSSLGKRAGLLLSFPLATFLTFGRWCWSCGGQGSPPGSMAASWLQAQALLLAVAQPAQGVSQSWFQQLDLIFLQLQPLLQVGNPVLHVHVAAGRHRVIWTWGERV